MERMLDEVKCCRNRIKHNQLTFEDDKNDEENLQEQQ